MLTSLMGNTAGLLLVGVLFAFFATALLLKFGQNRLPRDLGRDFAFNGKLSAGNMSGASQLVESVWDDLTPKQKQEIRKMGFNVTE